MQFNDFLSAEEVDYMKSLAEKTGYERSGVGGLPEMTVQNMARTSQQVFLTAYEKDPTIKALNQRIQDVVGVPNQGHFECGRVFFFFEFRFSFLFSLSLSLSLFPGF